MSPERDFEDAFVARDRLTLADRVDEQDPTILIVEPETQEMFESRTYALGGCLSHAARERDKQEPQVTFQVALDAYLPLFEHVAVKVLAKQSKADGRISFTCVFVNGESRTLLTRRDFGEQNHYWKFVEDIESALVPRHLDPPLITTREQWRRYDTGKRSLYT